MIVGLCGLAGSGKDTAAAHLVARCGFRRLAFADTLRTALYALDPYVATADGTHALTDLVDRKGWDEAKKIPDVRRLLQRIGTEVGRDLLGADIWVDMTLSGVERGERIVVTDVRFPNEAAAIKARGGIVVEIVRPEVTGLAGSNGDHASEAMAFPRDTSIVNDGTAAELGRHLAALLRLDAPDPCLPHPVSRDRTRID